MDDRCLSCYQPLKEKQVDFHPACSRSFFGSEHPPILDYTLPELLDEARGIVIKSITLTGVQPKLTVTVDKKANADPKRSRFLIAGLWGGYILKPPPALFPYLPENEDLSMHLAKLFDIQTALHSLLRLKSGELVYITKRFDREGENKRPMEDMCQLTETLTENKYRGSVEKIAKVIMTYSSRPGYDINQLFHIVLFDFIIGNTDMHLKNYSLLTSEGNEIGLSPAYDLLNVKISYPEDFEESALTINGRKDKLELKNFNALAENVNIDTRVRDQIYLNYRNKFKQAVQLVNSSFLPDEKKAQYCAVMALNAAKLGW